jgi:hypothetical protein
VPDRYGPPGSRALRTGDVARLRQDGAVELLGRVDRQVKVRGHRVEPGAVEHALRQRQDVLEALVLPVVRDGATGLVAYLIPRPGQHPTPGAVHRDLAQRLPAPSVPGRIAVLAEFPMNANGKVDVAALPDPAPVDADPGGPDGERWTRQDLVVAEAFATALGLPEVGLHDGFFDLGGDSLTAVAVAVAVGGRLGGEVPVPAADCATVRGYATMVAKTIAELEEPR